MRKSEIKRKPPAALFAVLGGILVLSANAADARAVRPSLDLITPQLVQALRQLVDHPIVPMALGQQNQLHDALSPAAVREQDRIWVNEVSQTGLMPLVGTVMSNPLSNYLTSVQAGSLGLMSQILVVDRQGLNAGLTAPSDDFLQADERFFRDALDHRGDGAVLGEPYYHTATGTWRVDIAFPLASRRGQPPLGVTRMEINLTELERRSKL